MKRGQVIAGSLYLLVLFALYINYSVLFSTQKILIFDIGGSQFAIETYLSRGYKVIGISPNPIHYEQIQKQFSREIIQNNLILINNGIEENTLENDGGRGLFFYVNTLNKDWSSFSVSEGCRRSKDGSLDLSVCSKIHVETSSCGALIKRYGIPIYMKIHLQESDWICLQSLKEIEQKPKYISIQAKNKTWLKVLKDLGYTKYKVVSHGSSDISEFGEVVIDFKVKKKWRSYQEVLNDWPYKQDPNINWHWHASM